MASIADSRTRARDLAVAVAGFRGCRQMPYKSMGLRYRILSPVLSPVLPVLRKDEVVTRATLQPSYIPVSEISAAHIAFSADDEPGRLDDQTKAVLQTISSRGCIAFAAACYEWVIYRFPVPPYELLPYHCQEAFWLYAMKQEDHFDFNRPQFDEPFEPAEMAIVSATEAVLQAIYIHEHFGPPATEAAECAQLAIFVLADPAPFLAWQAQVLELLARHCARDEDAPDGKPVPRELFNPTFLFRDEDRNGLVESYVATVDVTNNRFLRPAEGED